MKIHEKYILRGIELGKNGLGTTAPNPMVGCVIVHNNTIIGEGFTSPFGGAHAEVNAIRSVQNKELLKKSTLYVTLEPCAHHGKTPPCVDLIISSKIPRVVIGVKDPHDKVGGKGIEKLLAAGCEVNTPVLESRCREHHRRFLTFHEKKRPYIILKWAQTRDGFMAPSINQREKDPRPYWITNRYSRQKVHQWRSEEQAIFVGTNTVLLDNPKLTTRSWAGHSPLRIIFDKDLKTPASYNIFDRTAETLIFTQSNVPNKAQKGIQYECIDFSQKVASQVCETLFKRNILSVIIEGGAATLNTFIESALWDEARIFTGTISFYKGLTAPLIKGNEISQTLVGQDTLSILRND
ncbi:bifunctional diaminohydroxyphosphoribosylaminopyrimidine deaminase/5-amino-6-(5-phosphoribosylamino)uracil reductase RibD [uncultured Muriicola sp.]|uniref:bifunctional diaminohydroxyphosphoribosylaminopyrimidine deaminase/5-amino-6-(5-phosphoribosylamino)uracil reductase RibD n=1 Tax=uncultured Muriicola sp. TaxID=1583102 RepID=UPI002626D812|nr:bifunctional diaminohydroxyphosphoribosylaminopyrimidine deaminase/5-amino-6-(5-phosphoribosylamino)uracil reductase RibD [uncultured Muriicola sp.]